MLQDGDAIHSQWASHGEDAVSSVLMAEQIRNEFTTETALDGKTEWVITFPTKSFYVDSYLTGSSMPLAPFIASADKGASCESAQFHLFDRESAFSTDNSACCLLPQPGPTTFCFSVNVLSLSQTITVAADLLSSPTRVFGSVLARNRNPSLGSVSIRSGWLGVDLRQHVLSAGGGLRQLRSSLEGHRFIGLPVVGFAAIHLENRQAAPGLRASYGGAYVHKRKTNCIKINDDGVSVACQ